MAAKRPYNVLIAGQCVDTLARVLSRLCDAAGFRHRLTLREERAELRIVREADLETAFPDADIPRRELDLLLALDPWAAAPLAGRRTTVILNASATALLAPGHGDSEFDNPVAQLHRMGVPLLCRDFESVALRRFGTARRLAFVMGEAAIVQGLLPFDLDAYGAAFDGEAGERVA